MKLSEGKIRHMKALATGNGIIAAAAMDQRGSLQKSIAAAKGIDKKEVTPEMMAEFKTAVAKVLTPYASAILLDPEFGLEAAKVRAKNCGLLLAYEKSGYDNTQPGRLPDLLPHVSVKRIADWGANAVKILMYYTPFEDARINDIKHAFVERVGAECLAYEIPFFLEFVGYDPKGSFYKETLVHKDDVLVGMHTYDDAFVYVSNVHSPGDRANPVDLAPTVLTLMGLPVPRDYDGRTLAPS
ncbi:MAG: tagatose 1,6-diphosphate aldolase [Bryobacteraceae bacterium]|nr:tagatose 1,6-diphosphate aldolase [Bryobacteraceae bacterium]